MSDTMKKLLPTGPISAWPDLRSDPNEDDWIDSDEEEWIVGVALRGIASTPYKLGEREIPTVYREIATVQGRELAVALAELLSSL
jgi:hypothetical protein